MEALAQQMSVATMPEMVDVADQNEHSLRNRILNSRVGRAAAAFITTLGIGLSADLAVSTASAHQAPVAHEASGGWTVLGGDPLVPGGIHSGHDFVRLVTSDKGKAAMQLEGLSSKEIAAVDLAAHQGKERACSMPYGETFNAMVFGINGASIDHNVTFLDPRYKNSPAPAFCIDAPVRGKNGKVQEVVHMKAPDLCANLSLVNRTHPKSTPKPKHHSKPEQHPAPVPVTPPAPVTTATAPAPSCSGDTANNGVNNGNGGQAQGGNCSTNNNCVAENSPGANVCSPIEVTPPPVTPPVTPPTPELPPTIAMENMPSEGGFVGDTQQFCAEATANPESDGVTVVFSDTYNMIPEGTIGYPDPNGDPNSYCVDETFNAVVPDEQVFATAIDNVDGQYASASSNPFPIRQSTGF